MAGLKNRENFTQYCSIKKGKIYTKQNGEEKAFDSIEGRIKKVDFVTETWNNINFNLAKFTMDAIGETYTLKVNIDSAYFRNLANALLNADPTEMVTITPFFKEEDGKNKAGCFVNQNGKALKHKYTKNNAGNMPEVVVVQFKGENKYDNTAQNEFFKEELTKMYNNQPLVEEPKNVSEEPTVDDDFDGGLPF